MADKFKIAGSNTGDYYQIVNGKRQYFKKDGTPMEESVFLKDNNAQIDKNGSMRKKENLAKNGLVKHYVKGSKSGRYYTVDKNGNKNYYAADGTPLREPYFLQKEGVTKNSKGELVKVNKKVANPKAQPQKEEMGLLEGMWESAKGAVKGAVKFAKGIVTDDKGNFSLTGGAKKVWRQTKKLFSNGIGEVANAAWEGIKNAGKKMFKGMFADADGNFTFGSVLKGVGTLAAFGIAIAVAGPAVAAVLGCSAVAGGVIVGTAFAAPMILEGANEFFDGANTILDAKTKEQALNGLTKQIEGSADLVMAEAMRRGMVKGSAKSIRSYEANLAKTSAKGNNYGMKTTYKINARSQALIKTYADGVKGTYQGVKSAPEGIRQVWNERVIRKTRKQFSERIEDATTPEQMKAIFEESAQDTNMSLRQKQRIYREMADKLDGMEGGKELASHVRDQLKLPKYRSLEAEIDGLAQRRKYVRRWKKTNRTEVPEGKIEKIETKIDKALEEGKITEAQAEALKARLNQQAESIEAYGELRESIRGTEDAFTLDTSFDEGLAKIKNAKQRDALMRDIKKSNLTREEKMVSLQKLLDTCETEADILDFNFRVRKHNMGLRSTEQRALQRLAYKKLSTINPKKYEAIRGLDKMIAKDAKKLYDRAEKNFKNASDGVANPPEGFIDKYILRKKEVTDAQATNAEYARDYAKQALEEANNNAKVDNFANELKKAKDINKFIEEVEGKPETELSAEQKTEIKKLAQEKQKANADKLEKKIEKKKTVNSLEKYKSDIEKAKTEGRISEAQATELNAKVDAKVAELRQAKFDSIKAEIAKGDKFETIESKLDKPEKYSDYKDLTVDQVKALKTEVNKTRLAKEIAKSDDMGAMKTKLDQAKAEGKITDAQYRELERAINDREVAPKVEEEVASDEVTNSRHSEPAGEESLAGERTADDGIEFDGFEEEFVRPERINPLSKDGVRNRKSHKHYKWRVDNAKNLDDIAAIRRDLANNEAMSGRNFRDIEAKLKAKEEEINAPKEVAADEFAPKTENEASQNPAGERLVDEEGLEITSKDTWKVMESEKFPKKLKSQKPVDKVEFSAKIDENNLVDSYTFEGKEYKWNGNDYAAQDGSVLIQNQVRNGFEYRVENNGVETARFSTSRGNNGERVTSHTKVEFVDGKRVETKVDGYEIEVRRYNTDGSFSEANYTLKGKLDYMRECDEFGDVQKYYNAKTKDTTVYGTDEAGHGIETVYNKNGHIKQVETNYRINDGGLNWHMASVIRDAKGNLKKPMSRSDYWKLIKDAKANNDLTSLTQIEVLIREHDAAFGTVKDNYLAMADKTKTGLKNAAEEDFTFARQYANKADRAEMLAEIQKARELIEDMESAELTDGSQGGGTVIINGGVKPAEGGTIVPALEESSAPRVVRQGEAKIPGFDKPTETTGEGNLAPQEGGELIETAPKVEQPVHTPEIKSEWAVDNSETMNNQLTARLNELKTKEGVTVDDYTALENEIRGLDMDVLEQGRMLNRIAQEKSGVDMDAFLKEQNAPKSTITTDEAIDNFLEKTEKTEAELKEGTYFDENYESNLRKSGEGAEAGQAVPDATKAEPAPNQGEYVSSEFEAPIKKNPKDMTNGELDMEYEHSEFKDYSGDVEVTRKSWFDDDGIVVETRIMHEGKVIEPNEGIYEINGKKYKFEEDGILYEVKEEIIKPVDEPLVQPVDEPQGIKTTELGDGRVKVEMDEANYIVKEGERFTHKGTEYIIKDGKAVEFKPEVIPAVSDVVAPVASRSRFGNLFNTVKTSPVTKAALLAAGISAINNLASQLKDADNTTGMALLEGIAAGLADGSMTIDEAREKLKEALAQGIISQEEFDQAMKDLDDIEKALKAEETEDAKSAAPADDTAAAADDDPSFTVGDTTVKGSDISNMTEEQLKELEGKLDGMSEEDRNAIQKLIDARRAALAEEAEKVKGDEGSEEKVDNQEQKDVVPPVKEQVIDGQRVMIEQGQDGKPIVKIDGKVAEVQPDGTVIVNGKKYKLNDDGTISPIQDEVKVRDVEFNNNSYKDRIQGVPVNGEKPEINHSQVVDFTKAIQNAKTEEDLDNILRDIFTFKMFKGRKQLRTAIRAKRKALTHSNDAQYVQKKDAKVQKKTERAIERFDDKRKSFLGIRIGKKDKAQETKSPKEAQKSEDNRDLTQNFFDEIKQNERYQFGMGADHELFRRDDEI